MGRLQKLLPLICLGFVACRPSQPLDLFGKSAFSANDEKLLHIAYYRSYPKSVQRLMQHADFGQSFCRNQAGSDPETMRACNRSDREFENLKKLGWCWDNPEHTRLGAQWMRCAILAADYTEAPDPAFAIKEGETMYSEQDIREAAGYKPYKVHCADDQVRLPPIGSAEAARFDIFGNGAISEQDQRDFPVSAFARYPQKVRELMRQHNIAMSHCPDYDVVIGLRACNRRNRLLSQIEDRGWCWGSKDHISSTDVWMKCSGIDGYTPDQPRADSALFDLEDMRKAEEEDRKHCL